MGNDGSLVSFQCLQSNLSNLTLRLAHKHLTGSGQHLLVLTLDLNLQQQDDGEDSLFHSKQTLV